jgi:hypothetical protein
MTANQGRCLAYQCQVFDIISYTVRTESCVADQTSTWSRHTGSKSPSGSPKRRIGSDIVGEYDPCISAACATSFDGGSGRG